VHEFTLEETAAALDSTADRVRGLVQRGRQTLRRSLAELWATGDAANPDQAGTIPSTNCGHRGHRGKGTG
jgi:ABC-type transporter Mla subunit MlaD